MSVYESIMQGLTEAEGYQKGKIAARTAKLTAPRKTAEARENGRNKTEGSPRRPFEAPRSDSGFFKRVQA